MRERWMMVGVGGAVVVALTLGFWAGTRTHGAKPSIVPPPLPLAATIGSAKSARPATAPAKPAPAPAVSTDASSNSTARTLLTTADHAVAHEQWLEARGTYQQILQEYPTSAEAIQAQQRLGDINIHLLLTPSPMPDAPFYQDYTVELGDTLGKIARQHRTTVELLRVVNHIPHDKILVGRPLRVPRVTFSVIVDKSQNTLTLKANEEVIKVYTVSTGREDQTPVGTFTIVNRLVDPPWYTARGIIPPGSPENILGTRWMGFSKPSYGIHGTTDASTIGQSVTAGCVRMRNEDVEELYTFLPIGTDVTIVG